ncbi:MAG: DUF1846 domain-containing protein [Spirochaetales bacterium]|nr:DUF1846 domain-containing protein [Spirochaetales bacterium]
MKTAAAGFDNNKYLEQQTAAILERVSRFENKLYLECGGKLIFDYHASRVLPGFDPNVKMRVFQSFKDKIDVIICIFAGDIEKKKIRADFGITYDTDTLKLIDDYSSWGLNVAGVVITRFEEQPGAVQFKNLLERRGIRVYTHKYTKGYPTDVDLIVSDEGYGANEYIETSRPVVVVTAPGPGSGKLATCLSQFYHDYRRGIRSGYAKLETFPIWNLPLSHPVNVAYEAATADLGDINLIDNFHLEEYGETSVNYNRDIEAFPVLKRIIEKITGEKSFYQSPTDMGVNRCGFGIFDDEIVKEAAKQEIIRRYFRASCDYITGAGTKQTIDKIKVLMDNLELHSKDRVTVPAARDAVTDGASRGKGKDGIVSGAAIQLKDGTLLTGSNSERMHAASALILNASKHLAGMPSNIHLIPQSIMSSVRYLKDKVLDGRRISLDLEEVLISLAISAANNPAAQMAMDKLKELRGCEVHLTHLPSPGDEAGLRKLGINHTSDPQFASRHLVDEV